MEMYEKYIKVMKESIKDALAILEEGFDTSKILFEEDIVMELAYTLAEIKRMELEE